MDSELQSIEKIKRQEQENDKKFREKRTLETMLASLKRNIHEAVSATSKLKEEFVEVTMRADVVNAELIKAQALRCALAAQLEASAKQLQQLKNESEEGISKVWEARNTFCNAVHKVSDQCDVWALFTKPNYIETTMKPTKLPTDNINIENHLKERLDTAKKRRQSLIYERDRLLNEPTFGEEFKRIKNALQFSLEMVAQSTKE